MVVVALRWWTSNKLPQCAKVKRILPVEVFGANAFSVCVEVATVSEVTTSCLVLATTTMRPWYDPVWCREAVIKNAASGPEEGCGKEDPQEWGKQDVVAVLEKGEENFDGWRKRVDNQPPSELSKGGAEDLGQGLEERGHERNEHDRQWEKIQGEDDFRGNRKIAGDEKHVVD